MRQALASDAALEVARRERSGEKRRREEMENLHETNETAFSLYLPAKSLANFLERLNRRSPNTAHVYHVGLKRFADYLGGPDVDSTARIIKSYDPYDLLDGFVSKLVSENVGANTVRSYVSAVKKWMRYHGLRINSEDIHERVELPKPEHPLDEAPTKEWLHTFLLRVGRKHRAAFLTLISGIRPQDLNHIRVSDIKWDEYPVRVIVPPKGKTKRGWETFITREAAEALKDYLGQRINNPSEHLFKINRATLSKVFVQATHKDPPMNSLISPPNSGQNRLRYKYHLYSLKKYFETQVTLAHRGDRSIALAWEGRHSYLDNYLRLNLEERRQLYLQTEPRLLILTPTPTQDELTARLKMLGFADKQIDALKELNLMPKT